jgi:hypothetical protein
MKFRMVPIDKYRSADYPYDYRIELTDYETRERKLLTEWLQELKIPHTTGGWNTGSVLYLREKDAALFALKWTA